MKNKCIFCNIQPQTPILFESKHFFAKTDEFPASLGHTLIISKRHASHVFLLSQEEWNDLFPILHKTKKYLDEKFKPDAYNIGVNNGEVAGQTIFHLHFHVIPRYKGDVKSPRGGIRNIFKNSN